MTVKKLSLAVIFLAAAAFVSAQTQPTSSSSAAMTPAPVTAVSRTIKATHYRLQGGSAKIDFHGGDQMQHASGEAKVEGKKTNFEIDAKFQGFEDATKFGLEYL